MKLAKTTTNGAVVLAAGAWRQTKWFGLKSIAIIAGVTGQTVAVVVFALVITTAEQHKPRTIPGGLGFPLLTVTFTGEAVLAARP